MRCLFLGKFIPHSTETYVEYALQQVGVTVFRYCVVANGITRPTYRQELVALQKLVRETEPQFVLFSKPEEQLYSEFIPWCHERGVITVCWLWDLYFGLKRRLPIQAKLCHIVFSTDGGHDWEWERAGIKHYVLRQGIHEPEHVFYEPTNEFDVCFVGSVKGHPSEQYRSALLCALCRRYKHRFILIQNKRGLELNRILSRVKIVVGDSHPSPFYWSNRVYEVTGRGGFLLHPVIAGIESEFEPETEIGLFLRATPPYTSFRSLFAAIDEWLENDEKRERARRAAFDRCGRDYTYTKRVERMLSILRDNGLK